MSYSELIMNLVGESPEKTRKSTLLAYLDGHRDARHAAAEIAAEADATIAELVAALEALVSHAEAGAYAGDHLPKGHPMHAARAALARVKGT